MARVEVTYHGTFRHITQKPEETVELPVPTLEKLVQALEGSYGKRFVDTLRQPDRQLKPGMVVVVNGQNCDWDTPLPEKCRVSFLSAIAGG